MLINVTNCLFIEMSDAGSSKFVPRLKDYHVSEEIGFLLPEPLVSLIRHFVFFTLSVLANRS